MDLDCAIVLCIFVLYAALLVVCLLVARPSMEDAPAPTTAAQRVETWLRADPSRRARLASLMDACGAEETDRPMWELVHARGPVSGVEETMLPDVVELLLQSRSSPSSHESL
jgi:hypothetical protein